ncbi:MAG: multicopper oxidase domain-containing protein [Caldilineaceae bacterium]|nr:multicopper oxidase domain-containing protein [Caldilineaceae bacterium]
MERKDYMPYLNGAGLIMLTVAVIFYLFQTVGRSDAAFTSIVHTSNHQSDAHSHHDHSHDHSGRPTGHTGDEGLILAPARHVERDSPAVRCPAEAPVRLFEMAALEVEITLNRYLDYDPQGRMYALATDLEQVRSEEAQNRAARKGDGATAVSIGLQGDAIQPLILRAHPGDCLQISLRNDLTSQAASFHLHGATLVLTATGEAATAANVDALAAPSQRIGYEWFIPPDEPEATHYFHSHGPQERDLTSHGLFGALIVEPAGSRFLNPRSGAEQVTGWDAVIQTPSGDSFREFAIIYHEIGDERYRHLNAYGKLVDQVDPYTRAYRPGDRAINYRSEPFLNRMALQQRLMGSFDESLAYSSYSFGDPATPIARSYLGDPTKERVIHGGSEVFHVHHVHGGSVRWPRQPGVMAQSPAGLEKQPPLTLPSERLDSQSVGPAETFDVAHECVSGGCQQGAGDYLVHCHVAHHYLAGMWMIWRVYNTLQNGPASTDSLPLLIELPDRQGTTLAAVTSQVLLVASALEMRPEGDIAQITDSPPIQFLVSQLPPAGVPGPYDATVLDWAQEGDLLLNEPESDRGWPGYASSTPGERPPILFDPQTGKLAYPLLRPHLGKRPPFAPNRGPAPFLEPTANGEDLSPPGAHGEASLCPENSRRQPYQIRAVPATIILNERARDGAPLTDPAGELFVLAEEAAAVQADPARRVPLAIRANAQEDCIDLLLASRLPDNRANHFLSKISLHIHFVQFDIQASDGVNAGFNYEQTVRPYTVEGERLRADARAGATGVVVTSTLRFQPGALVAVGLDRADGPEVRRIAAIDGERLIFDRPLAQAHAAGEYVSVEFVRYRWYPDAQTGTAYFHDHVNALRSWPHGLFGALIVEPPGSTYHHPQSGEPLRSGPLADIRTDAALSADIQGSFREMVLFVQDDHPRTRTANDSGGSFNLRVEPLAPRSADPAHLFSSQVFDEPATPILQANLGDPLVIRGLAAGTNDVHTLHVEGHWWRIEPFDPEAAWTNTAHLGISERADLYIPAAGGPQQQPGDYLYRNGRTAKVNAGSWGVVRVWPLGTEAESGLRPLPGREAPLPPPLCPADAPVRAFDLAALDFPLPMLGGKMGKLFVLQAQKQALLAGALPPEPLVLRVNQGDCITVTLTNETDAGPVSFYADLPALAGTGLNVGRNPTEQTILPGASGVYTYYAHPSLGERAALARDGGDPLANVRLGLYGALIVGPAGASYWDTASGEAISAGWRADVLLPDGSTYRDFALFWQDEDRIIGTHLMPYTQQVAGVVGLNYQNGGKWTAEALPETPLLDAYAGDPLRLHVLVPYSEQAHVFSLEGHRWPLQPERAGSHLLDSVQVGALEVVTIQPLGGAGGEAALPGDYLYGDHRLPYREAGLWGVLRVYPARVTDQPHSGN